MFKKEDFSFFPLQKCSSLHEIFSGKLFCSGERSDQRERMSHVPSNAETGVNRIPQKNQLQAPHWHGLDLCSPKIPLWAPRVKNSWQLQRKYSPNPPEPAVVAPLCFGGGFQTGPFASSFPPTFSICGKLIPWPHPSLASPGRFLASSVMKWRIQGVWICPWPRVPCDVLSAPKLMCSLGGWECLPPAARGSGDGIIILKKLLTSQSWKLWPRWKGKSL